MADSKPGRGAPAGRPGDGDHDHDPAAYGEVWAPVYDDEVAPAPAAMIDFLAARAGSGPALELAIGTGRVALPLRERGVPVEGIDASPAMVERLRARARVKAAAGPGPDLRVEVGDMTTVGMGRAYALVFVVANSLFLLPDQDAQVACFANAARHLAGRDARFVVHAFVPDLARFDHGQAVRTADVSDHGVSIEAARHDLAAQRIAVQYVSITADGGVELYPLHLRYAWPSELDLMARLTGLRLVERFGGFAGEPFTADSPEHVSVYGPS